MFNFRKKVSTILPQDTDTIVRNIHSEFDNAADRILAEAKQILATQNNSKARLMSELGFTQAAGVADELSINAKKKKADSLSKLVNEYKFKYPKYKFITEEIVGEICKKYSLVFDVIARYKGDIPEKNLLEIKSFDDKKHLLDDCAAFVAINRHSYIPSRFEVRYAERSVSKLEMENIKATPDHAYSFCYPEYKICAPINDMDTWGYELGKDGYTLQNIPDPIVLYPVIGGYFIVSKWGIEAEDKMLTNEKMN